MELAHTEDSLQRLIHHVERLERLLSFHKKSLTIDEAAEYCGLSPSYMYKMTSQRLLPHSKPNGKKIYFEKKALDEWMLKNPVKTRDELNSGAINYISDKNKYRT